MIYLVKSKYIENWYCLRHGPTDDSEPFNSGGGSPEGLAEEWKSIGAALLHGESESFRRVGCHAASPAGQVDIYSPRNSEYPYNWLEREEVASLIAQIEALP